MDGPLQCMSSDRSKPISIRWIFAIGTLLALPCGLFGQADRILTRIDTEHRLKVAGNLNPQARTQFDEGRVDPTLRLNYIQLMLKPTPAQQSDLKRLLVDQQDHRSPNFRKWLTPEQFADRFGVSANDIRKITDWLRSEGLDVIAVARGRRYIAFNATAQQIESAFKTEIHSYRVNGELHFANATEPSVPEAIQPLILGVEGLDDFVPKAVTRTGSARPHYTGAGGGHNVAPGDLAVIYDVLPIYQAGYTGAGMTIAVMGQSAVAMSDISAFQSIFGVPTNLPQTVLVPGSDDPGVTGDEGEAALDLEFAGGMAYDANVIFVYSTAVLKSTAYAIDQRLAPVISYSYGSCEAEASTTGAQSLESLAQQANAEGITWLVASGDHGAAMCDSQAATQGASVNIVAAVPEVTGVGGTMFTGNSLTYWSSQNTSNGTSALSYIPETAWDESTETRLSSSGGGFSTFFEQPAWQNGPGLPSGGSRGVPDVALTSGVNDDPYTVISGGQPTPSGGTSAATPTFAAMILLLNQYLGTDGLGNINPSLYWMAQSSSGVFHDITTGGNYVPCVGGSPNCGTAGNFGYAAGPGWDPATGLGSIDATQMFEQWNVAAGTPQIGTVVNGASLTDSGVSPGLIFTIFGSALGPLAGQTLELDGYGNVSPYLANITVSVNGTQAPLLYVGPGQINAVAPYEIAGSVGQRVVVQVNDGGQVSNEFTVNVVATAPAIFSLGNDQGAILNQDGSVNGPNNPAATGSYIQIYGTGEGQLNPAGVDGQIATEDLAGLPRPVARFSLTIGGKPANYTYAGTAPQSFEGFLQVNVQIPENLPSGNQPVVLNIGGVSSPPMNVVVK